MRTNHNPTTRRMPAMLLAVLAVLAAGCGASAQPPPEPPARPAELVMSVVVLPGLLPPGGELSLPDFSLYGDGRIVMGIHDDRSLPAPQERRVTAAGIRQLLAAASDAGLTRRTDYGQPQLPDAPSGIFQVVANGRRQVTRVLAPDTDLTGDPSLGQDQQAARARLRDFRGRLINLDSWLAPHLTGAATPYRYPRMAVFALRQEPDPAAPPPLAWPLGPLATAGEPMAGGRCVIVAGEELARVRTAAKNATPATPWQDGGSTFHLAFRPLLPDENSCRAAHSRAEG
jgi:hypothetical protein